MKLHELTLIETKRADTALQIKLKRKKVEDRNRKKKGVDKYDSSISTDSFIGYNNDTFAQSNWE